MPEQTIEGYIKNGLVYRDGQQVELPEGKFVTISVEDRRIKDNARTERLKKWDEFKRVVKEANEGKKPLSPDDFPRMIFKREIFDSENGEE